MEQFASVAAERQENSRPLLARLKSGVVASVISVCFAVSSTASERFTDEVIWIPARPAGVKVVVTGSHYGDEAANINLKQILHPLRGYSRLCRAVKAFRSEGHAGARRA